MHINNNGISIYDPINPANNKRYDINALAPDVLTSITPQVTYEYEDEGQIVGFAIVEDFAIRMIPQTMSATSMIAQSANRPRTILRRRLAFIRFCSRDIELAIFVPFFSKVILLHRHDTTKTQSLYSYLATMAIKGQDRKEKEIP